MTPAQRKPGAYDPLLAARRPGGKPDAKPKFRILIHKRHLPVWDELVRRVGLLSAQQFWDHVAFRADQPPLLGTCTPMKGGHNKGKGGWSRVMHYEISGAGRVDYQFHPAYEAGSVGDKHPVVRIVSLNWSSH